MKKVVLFALITLLAITLAVFLIRLFSSRQLDDVSPGIPCSSELMKKADVLFVIPKFNNIPINRSWCSEILALNKTLGMHGVTHEYKEFNIPRNARYYPEADGREHWL